MIGTQSSSCQPGKSLLDESTCEPQERGARPRNSQSGNLGVGPRDHSRDTMVAAVVVDLSGGDVAVTQQILDLAVVRANVESRVAGQPYYSAERLQGVSCGTATRATL